MSNTTQIAAAATARQPAPDPAEVRRAAEQIKAGAADPRTVAAALVLVEHERKAEADARMEEFRQWASLSAQIKSQLVATARYDRPEHRNQPAWEAQLIHFPAKGRRQFRMGQPRLVFRAVDELHARERYLELCGLRIINNGLNDADGEMRVMLRRVAEAGAPTQAAGDLPEWPWRERPPGEGDSEQDLRERLAQMERRLAALGAGV